MQAPAIVPTTGTGIAKVAMIAPATAPIIPRKEARNDPPAFRQPPAEPTNSRNSPNIASTTRNTIVHGLIVCGDTHDAMPVKTTINQPPGNCNRTNITHTALANTNNPSPRTPKRSCITGDMMLWSNNFPQYFEPGCAKRRKNTAHHSSIRPNQPIDSSKSGIENLQLPRLRTGDV